MSSAIIEAAVAREADSVLHLEELRLADPGFGEVRVRIAAVAVCGSDLAYIDGAWEFPRPAVFGQEASGVVDGLGPGVEELDIGDRVVISLVRYCQSCRHCVRGDQIACSGSFPSDGRSHLSDTSGQPVERGLRVGAFASAAIVHQSQVVRIDHGIGLDVAALLACSVMTGAGAVFRTAEVPSGAHVLVLGCGGVGLNILQAARLAQAATVIAIDPDPAKLVAAERFGATDNLKAAVSEATGGAMADYVFVATSSVKAAETGFGLLAGMGALVLVGMPPTGVTARLDVGTVASLNQRILGSKMGSCRPAEDIPMLSSLYRQGRWELDALISGRYPLDHINRALDSARRGDALRNLVIVAEDLVP